MNIHVQKTEAEIGFAETFDAVSDGLPGGAALRGVRADAMKRFVAMGLPSRRSESYRYTDLKSLVAAPARPQRLDEADLSDEDVVRAKGRLGTIDAHTMLFLNGRYRMDGSDGFYPLSAAVEVDDHWVHEALNSAATNKKDLQADAVFALNTGLMADGYVLDVTASSEKPFHAVFTSRGEAGLQVTRNVVRIAAGAKATLIETFSSLDGGAQQANNMTQIVLDEGASLDHIRVQDQNFETTHLDSCVVDCGETSSYRAFVLTTGCKISRNSVFSLLSGEHVEFDYSGVFLGRDKQHSDTTMYVDHAVPHGTSRELFKTVLDDDARAVFQGKVMVKPQAQKTDGKQMSQALLLSETAEFDGKPELEIFADDVVCGHGATSGQIDEDLLFYLRARGIPEDQARGLLIQAFVGEALEQISSDDIREALADVAVDWFVSSQAS